MKLKITPNGSKIGLADENSRYQQPMQSIQPEHFAPPDQTSVTDPHSFLKDDKAKEERDEEAEAQRIHREHMRLRPDIAQQKRGRKFNKLLSNMQHRIDQAISQLKDNTESADIAKVESFIQQLKERYNVLFQKMYGQAYYEQAVATASSIVANSMERLETLAAETVVVRYFKDLQVGQTFHQGKNKSNSTLCVWMVYQKTGSSKAKILGQYGYDNTRQVGSIVTVAPNTRCWSLTAEERKSVGFITAATVAKQKKLRASLAAETKSFKDIQIGQYFHMGKGTGVGANAGTRMWLVLQKTAKSKAMTVKQIGYGNTRSEGQISSVAPNTRCWVLDEHELTAAGVSV